MDPDAALALLLQAIADEDRDAAIEHVEALAQWLRRGGHLPSMEAEAH